MWSDSPRIVFAAFAFAFFAFLAFDFAMMLLVEASRPRLRLGATSCGIDAISCCAHPVRIFTLSR